MNNNENIKKSILENVLVISLMTLYMLFGIQLIPIGIILVPIPFIVIGVRNGIWNNIISMIITSAIVGLIMGTLSALTIVLIFVPVSFIINYCIKDRRSARDIILYGSLAFLLSITLSIALESQIADMNIAERFETYFVDVLTGQMESLKDSGMNQTEILQSQDTIETILKGSIMIIPSTLILLSLISTYLNYLISALILRKMGIAVIDIPNFSKIKLPNNFILGSGIMFLSAYLMEKAEMAYSQVVLLNITFLVITAFVIQGFSVFDHFLKKIKIRTAFRIFILAINIIIMPVSTIILLLGFLDGIFDFRKIRKKNPK